jgi:nitroreductase
MSASMERGAPATSDPAIRAEQQGLTADTRWGASTDEDLRLAISYAILAPSSHNTQPWLFHVRDDAVELFADRARALPVVDPFDRELVIGCGAALFNLRIALACAGWNTEVEILPDPSRPDLLARVALAGHLPPSQESRMLFDAIPKRHTNRGTFEPRAVPALLEAALRRCVAAEGAWLETLDGPAKLAASDLIAAGDRIQQRDTHFRRELAAWTVPNDSARADGIKGHNLGLSDLASSVAPLLIRTFDWAKLGRAARDRELAAGSPLLCALGTRHEEPAAWIAAGQALQHMWLAACVAGVQCSFLNQSIEVPTLRSKLRMLIGRGGFPQLVLRLGFAEPSRACSRRNVAAVLI